MLDDNDLIPFMLESFHFMVSRHGLSLKTLDLQAKTEQCVKYDKNCLLTRHDWCIKKGRTHKTV